MISSSVGSGHQISTHMRFINTHQGEETSQGKEF